MKPAGAPWPHQGLPVEPRPAPGAAAPERFSIAVFSRLLAGTFFSEVMAGVTAAAAGTGASVVGIQTLDPSHLDLDRVQQGRDFDRRVGWDEFAGVIALVEPVQAGYLQDLAAAGRPVVSVAHAVEGLECPVVSADNRSGMASAVEHLIAHGHRRIGFAGYVEQDDVAERYEAYRETMRRHGLEIDDRLVLEIGDNVETGGESAAAALLERGLLPSGIVTATDRNAVGLMGKLGAAGIVVPRDLALVSFDDSEQASMHVPSISTVRQDLPLVGATAFRLLTDAIAGRPVLPGRYRLPTAFLARSSCGCDARRSAPLAVARSGDSARDRLRRRLAKLLLAPGASPAAASSFRRAAELLAELFEVPGGSSSGELDVLATALVATGARWERLVAVIDCARLFGEDHDRSSGRTEGSALFVPQPGERRERLATELSLALSRAYLGCQTEEKLHLGQSLRDEYRLSLDLLRHDGGRHPRDLQFLARTPTRVACLGLWQGGDPANDVLEIAGVYHRFGVDEPDLPGRVPIGCFPPRALSELADQAAGELTIVLPIRSESADWGLLALIAPIPIDGVSGRDFYFQCAALLSAALDQDHLLSSLRRQQRELESRQAELHRQQHQLEQHRDELRRSEERYAMAATAASDGLWDWDVKDAHLFLSDRWKEMLGLAREEVGTGIEEWFSRVHPDDRAQLDAAVEACLGGVSDALYSEHRLRTRAGGYRWMRCRALAVPGSGRPAERIVGSTTDITVQWEFEQRLRHQALHDALTGLPNRTYVLERAEQMLGDARHRNGTVAALFIDLDDFKEVNDSLGHSSGDALLISVASRLRGAVRAEHLVGRLGGDEFVVLAGGKGAGGAALQIAERIRVALRAPFELLGREFLVSASIGVATASEGTAVDLLRDADVAMYQAKGAGKNRYVAFEANMHLVAQDRLRLELDLSSAIGNGELRVLFQPIVQLDTLEVLGMEALVRWQHPRLGLLPPAEFIDIAESNGRLIVDLGRFVLGEACKAAAGWHRCGSRISVSVNISARQLGSDELLADVTAALAATGLDPRHLVIEVTETAIMKDSHAAIAHLLALKELGVRIAIDDFGTGYSSLAYLRQLPVDVLKIDRSFITSMPESMEAGAVVETLLNLARTLDLEVVAEGIEIPGQLEALRQAGCEKAQGFLFARPLEASQVNRFISGGPLGGGR